MIDPTWDSVFVERLSRHYDELKWLYMELYNGDQGAFDYFLSMLEKCYEKRSSTLREWDEKRCERGDWYADEKRFGMLMYVDSFAGNLQGVREHLDYIRETGVNYLHFMPLLESPEGRSDGGYAVSDFRQVDPKLGTMDDLAAIAGECHDNEISVCLDFVMNHTSEDH